MSIFQKSVVNKYLKTLDDEKINQAFDRFTKFYGDKLRLYNILHLKEENYQEGFLREIFVNVLGYTINPDLNYNLTTEYKNQTDSKKADGAILIENRAIAVIELKSTKRSFLDSITNQAFNYKNNQPDCRYVITSNFHHLRFYIDNATEFEEFDLFTLTIDNFKRLYLFLSKESVFNETPLKLKEETKFHEESITSKFYRDYKQFKDKIFENLVTNNSQYDKLILFKKSQKLLDRFLFVYFAEDCGLCPPNSVQKIIDQWKTLNKIDAYAPLYSRFQKLFTYLDVGKKFDTYEFPGYNGGLFQPDELLDNPETKVDDKILLEHCPRLSNYDFSTEIDVNILGHIFEHSLNEIEEITAELKGESTDKSKSKRKKDGIFYTPKYITNYIVENTIGFLCTTKKIELQINEIEITETYRKNGKITKAGKELHNHLQDYKKWLLNLKIIDPACGSGAFLIAALDFLIAEHQSIDDLISDLTGDKMRLFDTDKTILENNIFGVDINEESVEIAKLSLWLRTARKDRKLSDLYNNIKCGNSLIDNTEIAGEKAFNWHKEFPEIMQNGGFDVVIGNPPYVNVELMPKSEKEYFKTSYSLFFKRADLFSLFLELAINKLSEKGNISFILPSILLNNLSYKLLRNKLIENNWLREVCYVGGSVFQDATVDTIIISICKAGNQQIRLVNAIDFTNKTLSLVDKDYFHKFNNLISVSNGTTSRTVYDRIFDENNLLLSEHFDVFQGIVTGNNPVYILDQHEQVREHKIENELLHTLLHGRDFGKWYIKNTERKILYINDEIEIGKYPHTLNYLSKFKTELETSKSSDEKTTAWYCLHRPRVKSNLDLIPKIIIQNTRNETLKPRIVATVDEIGYYGSQGLNFVIPKTNEYSVYFLIAIINSKLIDYVFATKFLNLAIKAEYIKQIRFPKTEKDIQLKLENLSKLMLNNTKEIEHTRENFANFITNKYDKTLNQKIEFWYSLDFKTLVSEFKKLKINLSLAEEKEWFDYYKQEKTKIIDLISNTEKIDSEINQIVFNIYGLTTSEIEVVENIAVKKLKHDK